MAGIKPKFEPDPAQETLDKARPAPHIAVPVALPPSCKMTTVAEPFSFELRDQITVEKKDEKIKQICEEEKKVKEFHAKSIMKEDAVKPFIQRMAPTKPEPFKLQIEERVGVRLFKLQDDVKEKLEEQKKAAQFKTSEPKVGTCIPLASKNYNSPFCRFWLKHLSCHLSSHSEKYQTLSCTRIGELRRGRPLI